MQVKTNAARILESLKIPFELKEYPINDADLSAEHVAKSLGISAQIIYKTLVLKGSNDPYLVVLLPGDSQLDLKKIAKVSGNKSCEMLPLNELLNVTGYIRGGCSPIGMKKKFPTYIEEIATIEPEITISAGKRGVQIVLQPKHLQQATQAIFADLIL